MLPRLLCLLGQVFVLATCGWCLTAETVPESGAIVAGVENETNILLQCVVRTSTALQRVTAWFLMRTTDASAIQITNEDSEFSITGDPVPDELLLYNTNLTILTLTADFDQAVVFCGETTDRDLANFTIRIYTPPVLQDVGIVPAVEGYASPNGSLGLEQNEPFPIPTKFTWTRDNETLVNSSRLDLGYPDLTINPVSRYDRGRYTLTASNFRLDNDTALIGTGSGGFYLDVYYGPEFTDDPSQLDEAGTLEGDPITLVCGENLDGNPTPVVEWTDSTGTPVPRNLSSRYTFNDGPGVVSLSLSSTTAADRGNWTCTVRGEEPLPPITRIISVFFLEPPSPPLNVRLDTDSTGTTSLGIQWFVPTFEGFPPFSSYNFYVDPPTGFDYSTARLNELNETTRAFTVTGLLAGVTYRLTVTAVSEAFGAVAESNRSDAFEATTDTTGIPTTPVILLVTSEAPGEVLLIVQVRAAGVGPSPHSLAFDVLAVQGTFFIDLGGVPQPNYVDGTPAVISIKDNRLEPNQTYSFHVRARNMFGASEYVSSALVIVKKDSEDSAGTSGGSSSSCTGVVVGISVSLLVAVAIIVTLSIIIVVLWRKKVGAPMKQHNGRQVYYVNPQVHMSELPASQDPEARDYESVGIYDEVDQTGAVNPTALGVSSAVAPNIAYGLVPPPAQSCAAHT